MDKTLLFIVNPRAGKTKSSAPLFDAVATFGRAGYLVRVMLTQAAGDAARFAAMSLRRASCRWRSGRSRDFSLVIPLFVRRIFFGTGGGNCSTHETNEEKGLGCGGVGG